MRTPQLLVLLLFTALLAGHSTSPALFAQSSGTDNSPSVIGVKMDADWCPKCHEMNPKLDNIMPEFEGDGILFVKFNMTDDFTQYQAGLLANRMGLSELFNENRGQTGYMLLVDASTHKVLERLNSDQSEQELIADINRILNSVR